MVFGEVQGFEIVPIGLDFRPLGDIESQACENVTDPAENLVMG